MRECNKVMAQNEYLDISLISVNLKSISWRLIVFNLILISQADEVSGLVSKNRLEVIILVYKARMFWNMLEAFAKVNTNRDL